MINLCKHCKLVNPSAGTRLVTKGAESEQHHSSATVVILCRGLCWSPCASACARCWSPADVRDLGLPSVVKAPSPSSSSAWSLAVGRAEGQVLARRKHRRCERRETPEVGYLAAGEAAARSTDVLRLQRQSKGRIHSSADVFQLNLSRGSQGRL